MTAVNPIALGLAIVVGAGAAIVSIFLSMRKREQSHASSESTFGSRSTILGKCGVCLQPISPDNDFTLPCSHKFHKFCLRMVFECEVQKSCPLGKCRRIVDESVVREISK